ncbi:acetylxylan esterase [Amnibacterium soli]|uniref:Acetylxylan esterase n=1 Tax=Amnibacterium soli TaxID=1282736 RepID=A0ABP8Z5B9_9MICO
MPLTDLPLAELQRYRSAVPEPADFDGFWGDTLRASRELAFAPVVTRVDAGLTAVEVHDVTFSGYDGEPIKAWLHRPVGADGDAPIVVRYVGYNCGRGLPHMVHPLALAGSAVLTVDNRGQGSVAGYASDTSDIGGLRRAYGGHITRGIESRETYYYRRLYTDAVLAVDAARQLPGVDADRLAVAGVSQGGGIALAVAGLAEGIGAALIDVPFLSDVPRGVDLSGTIPYSELAVLLASYPGSREAAFGVLEYFDGVHFAARAEAPALFSVGLMDAICPPSTVYAAFNAYAGEKELQVYHHGGHEGGGFAHEALQLERLPALLAGAGAARS